MEYKRDLLTSEEMNRFLDKVKNESLHERLLEVDENAPWLMNMGIALSVMIKGMNTYDKGADSISNDLSESGWHLVNSAINLIDMSVVDTSSSSLILYSGLASIRMKGREKTIGTSEKDYHDELCTSFGKYLPDLTFIDREVQIDVDDRDRLDILAESKDGRPVIIELKLGKKSAHKQLRSYAVGFENPILINISEELPPNRRSDINYMTFKGIGIDFDENNSKQLISEGVV